MIGSSTNRTIANDVTIAWSELGSGPPLVLLHGLADSHRTWRLVAPILAEHFRVIMMDLPGHGLSARPEAPYTLPWYADTVALWMDAVGVERAHFCGHSYGGGVAQWMLVDHRHRIDRLALAAAGGLGREVGAILRLASLPIALPLLDSGLFGPITKAAMRWTCPLPPSHDAELARLASMNSAPNSGLAFHRTVSACIGLRGQFMQTWDHLHKVESLPPLALFWGGRDSIIPVEHAHDAALRFGNATVTVYPESGHSLHLDSAEPFADDLTSFLKGDPQTVALVLAA